MKTSENKLNPPLFIVGCPRSGTTLLQSLLAAHSAIASFPETHFFAYLIHRRRWARALGLASPEAATRLEEFLTAIGHKEMARYIPFQKKRIEDHVAAFKVIMNNLTLERGKIIWLEKTPEHLHFIKYIDLFFSKAKIIHIVRQGTDTIASLYTVTNEHPADWGGARDIDQCIARWTSDIKESYTYLKKPNHFFVTYNNLIHKTAETLNSICTFIGIPFESEMLNTYTLKTETLSQPHETWKLAERGSIKNRNSLKFQKIFSLHQQQYISDRIKHVSLHDFDNYTGKAAN